MSSSLFASPNNPFSANLLDLVEFSTSGILSKVLLRDKNSQYDLLCVTANSEIEEHTSTRNATISVVVGKGMLTLEDKNIVLIPGVFVFMPANYTRAVEARENLAFLLIFSE